VSLQLVVVSVVVDGTSAGLLGTNMTAGVVDGVVAGLIPVGVVDAVVSLVELVCRSDQQSVEGEDRLEFRHGLQLGPLHDGGN